MARALKICAWAGPPSCANLTRGTYCEDHQPESWSGSTRRSELPPDWDRRRRYILQRDPVCKVCDDALSTEVDHIDDPHDHSYENLQGICSPCHDRKTQAEAASARKDRG